MISGFPACYFIFSLEESMPFLSKGKLSKVFKSVFESYFEELVFYLALTLKIVSISNNFIPLANLVGR